jgi:hypothetical protein
MSPGIPAAAAAGGATYDETTYDGTAHEEPR